MVQSSSEVTLHLQGKWREARAKRTGLNDMLYYLGERRGGEEKGEGGAGLTGLVKLI